MKIYYFPKNFYKIIDNKLLNFFKTIIFMYKNYLN